MRGNAFEREAVLPELPECAAFPGSASVAASHLLHIGIRIRVRHQSNLHRFQLRDLHASRVNAIDWAHHCNHQTTLVFRECLDYLLISTQHFQCLSVGTRFQLQQHLIAARTGHRFASVVHERRFDCHYTVHHLDSRRRN